MDVFVLLPPPPQFDRIRYVDVGRGRAAKTIISIYVGLASVPWVKVNIVEKELVGELREL